ncbi:toxin VasX, partial [Zooshikella ganghwensis]|uniref:toxin VasX n=1 Tax=Zooshikella ganghwensis TaxID=202772 RepID=UPI00048671F3
MSDTSNNSPYGKPANREEARAEIVDGATVNGIAQCPVTEEFIYLYPTRYALVEKKVDYPSLRPGFSATIKPIGVRLARKGFVYLFHSLKPDELLSFEIQHDGEQSRYWEQKDQVGNPSFLKKPIKLKRQGYIEVAYSEVAWSASKIAELKADPRLRYEYMQRVQLGDYDFGDGATHLVPLSEIGNVLSECIGKEQAEKPAKRKHSLPFEWIDFSWSSLPLAGASTGKVLNETQGTSFNTALLVLHDMLGVLHDLDMHAECIYREKREWYEKNKQALHSGQFIRGLYHITKGDLNNHLKTSEDYQKLDELDQESLEAFTRVAELRNEATLLRHKATRFRQSEIRSPQNRQQNWYKRYQAMMAQADAKDAEASRIEEKLKRKHGSKYEDYKQAVEEYRFAKLNMYKDVSMWNVPRIEQRVRTKAMEVFLDDADELAQCIAELEEENSLDRASLLPKFNKAVWYFDITIFSHVQRLHETHFCCVANLCGDAEGKG